MVTEKYVHDNIEIHNRNEITQQLIKGNIAESHMVTSKDIYTNEFQLSKYS